MCGHSEPDILVCEVSGRITVNTASGGDGIPAEPFKTLTEGTAKVLHSVCLQIWKTQQWPQDWKKISFHSNHKEGSCQGMFKLHQNCIHFTG